MQVTITRTIQIPDGAQRINENEERIHSFGLSLTRELLREAWQNSQNRHWSCEVCGSENIIRRGYRDYTVTTILGRVKLRRARVRCHECGKAGRASDSGLKKVEGSRVSAKFAELASSSEASWPYRPHM